MKVTSLLPLLLVVSSGTAQAAGLSAASVKNLGAFQLSIYTAQVGVELTRDCGLQLGQTLISGIQKKQSSLELQKAVGAISAEFPQCDQALQDYKVVANEIYQRQNASLIAFQKKHATLSSQLNQAIVVGTNEVQVGIDPTGLTAVEDRPDSFLVSGLVPSGSTALAIVVQKAGDANATDLQWSTISGLPVAPVRWQKRIYNHEGPGSYSIEFMQQTPESQTNVWTQASSVSVTTTANQNPFLLPSDQVQSDDPTIVALSRQITSVATSDLEKLEAIHDWVSKNISYDYDLLNKMSQGQDPNKVYGEPLSATLTLKKKTGICEEYSYLTAALLRAVGIPAKVIHGQSSEGPHAWNNAFADGRWIILDTTWDAVDGRAYFDPTPAQFAKDHTAAQDTLF